MIALAAKDADVGERVAVAGLPLGALVEIEAWAHRPLPA